MFQIPSPKRKVVVGSTIQKPISLLITMTKSMNIQIDKIVYRSELETSSLASFLTRGLNHTAINIFLQKLETLTIAKFTNSTRQILRCKQRWNLWEQLRCVVHSPLIVGMTIALSNWLGTCIVRTQCLRIYFVCTKDF